MKWFAILSLFVLVCGCGPAPAPVNKEVGDAANAAKAEKGTPSMTPSEPL